MKDKFTKLNGHITSLEAEFLGNKFNVSDYQVSYFIFNYCGIKYFQDFSTQTQFQSKFKRVCVKKS